MNEWPERRARWIWKPIEDLAWCRRKMAEMTEVEREFVEAAVFDAEGNFAPDLDRMKAMLEEYPSLVETAGAAALTAAIRGKDTDEVVRFLVDNGAQFEYQKDAFSPVHDAVWSASHGQRGIEKFRIIFESGLADAAQIGIRPPHNGLSSSHRSLLHITATFGHPPLTKLLLEHGAGKVIEARLNQNADTALHRAAQAGHWWGRRRAVAEILLAHGAYYDIFSACSLDDGARQRELATEDPHSVHERHSDKTTPLHWAAAAGAVKCVESILDGGADVDALNSGKKTPLHKAAAPLDAVPIDWTFPPVHRVISILVERGANIDAQDNKGRTPLHLATYGGFADAAAHLIALGADTTIRNKRGKTPLEVARLACLHLKPGRRKT